LWPGPLNEQRKHLFSKKQRKQREIVMGRASSIVQPESAHRIDDVQQQVLVMEVVTGAAAGAAASSGSRKFGCS